MTLRRAQGRDGFTLIETLVALGVIAFVMAVTVRGVVVARLGLERAQATLAAEAVARSIVETELDRLAAAPGVVEGETDGIGWTVTAEPIDLPLPPAPTEQPSPPPQGGDVRTADRAAGDDPAPDGGAGDRTDPEAASSGPPVKWAALRVVVSVANGRGRPLTVETVHLARAQQ